MNYGLWLSATGVVANSYKQDVIANNLANAETIGFRRDLTLFQERLTEAQQRNLPRSRTNPLLEDLGGGLLVVPTRISQQQGSLDITNNPLDMAIDGEGFFAVEDRTGTRLTRDGRFMVDRDGFVVTAGSNPRKLLDENRKPIRLLNTVTPLVAEDGAITQNSEFVANVGVFNVDNPTRMVKGGGSTLMIEPGARLARGSAAIRSRFVEQANVDPAIELTSLMQTQRELEANANMIRYQDQMMARVVNDVGKIS